MTALAISPRAETTPATQTRSQRATSPSYLKPVEAAQNSPLAAMKVLLVEDDLIALEELRDIIDFEGWNPITANTVEDALERLEADPEISVVVTDVHFVTPTGKTSSGIQFVSRAQAKFHDRDLSFIVLSGDPAAMASSAQEGAFDFLSKPVIPDSLIDAVKSAASGEKAMHGESYIKNFFSLRLEEAAQPKEGER